MRRRRALCQAKQRIAEPGEGGLQLGIVRSLAVQPELGQHLLRPGVPDLSRFLDLLEQLVQRPWTGPTGAIAGAPQL
jgi:hypothetical protein